MPPLPGPQAASEPLIRVIAYGPDAVEESTPRTLSEARALIGRQPVTWINVNSAKDPDVLKSLETDFQFHPLAIEDVQNTRQRPKVEDYGEYLFIVIRMAYFLGDDLVTEQMSCLLGKNVLITIQESPGDAFDPVRARIRQGRKQIRSSGPDYLCYALADRLVDSVFPLLEGLGNHLDALEDRISEDPRPEDRDRLQVIRRQLNDLRQFAWPQREAMVMLERGDLPLVKKGTRTFFRDVADHTIRTMDIIESHRERASDLHDLYLSGLTMRTNEAMKLLTLIATVFIPLTFITSVYGMNFDPDAGVLNMPELRWRYGYPAVLAGMGALAILMVWYFRRRSLM